MKRMLFAGSACRRGQPDAGAATRRHRQDRLIVPLFRPVRRRRPAGQRGHQALHEQHGDTVAGKKIEIIRKDVGGINPPVAKRLAQELVTRDNVDILAGSL